MPVDDLDFTAVIRSGWDQWTGKWTCSEEHPVFDEWLRWKFGDEITAHRFARHALDLWNAQGAMIVVLAKGIAWNYGEPLAFEPQPPLDAGHIEIYLARLEQWIDDNSTT